MVGVRLSPEEYEAVEREAEEREWSLAQCLRHYGLKTIRERREALGLAQGVERKAVGQ